MKKVTVVALMGWLLVTAASARNLQGTRSMDVTPLSLPGHLVSRIDDPQMQSLVLAIPTGSAAVVIQPDTGEGTSQGYIEAVDAQGQPLIREGNLSGLAVELADASDSVRGMGLTENDPLVIMVPSGTSRMEIEGQYYDEQGDPKGDGAIRCYDSEGNLLFEEANLKLDLFMF